MKKIVSGALLITGTCVGAGILALPVATGPAGFYPACAINTLCWVYMLITGLFFLEATLWMPDGANVISISTHFLGKRGRIVTGVSFLFLYYCLLVSYIAGGAPIFQEILEKIAPLDLGEKGGYWLFSILFGAIVFLGTRFIDRVNWLLMSGLILSYLLILGIGSREVQSILLHRQQWSLLPLSVPILFSAYGFHNVIPSVCTYLKRNASHMRYAIFFGTLLPFVIYTAWQWLIIGSIPQADLQQAAEQGIPISQTLQATTGHSWIYSLAIFFGLFALITSFLGVSLSLVDFLGDGLQIKKRTGWRRLGLCLLIFLPTTLFAAEHPGIFLYALGLAGGYGETILNGLLPVALVWVGLYRMGKQSKLRIPGGQISLLLLFLFSLVIMGIETYILVAGEG